MTLDELKVEADKFGYKLIKKSVRIKMLPCICGCNKRTEWFDSRKGQTFYSCDGCGKKSPMSNTTNGAKRAWNEMIEEKLKERKDE